ncbi:hypothetical protein JCM17823_00560 [Halorubrum gandharaense]
MTGEDDLTDEKAPAGTVKGLVTAPAESAPPEQHETVEIVSGGVSGDRYCRGDGHFQLDACAVTLVAAEALDAVHDDIGVDLSDGRHRRNVVVRGFDEGMDPLLNATVAVGNAHLRPMSRRPPCAHLEQLAGEDGVASALKNRGGLCCDVVEPGAVSVGDTVQIVEADPRTAGAAIAERLENGTGQPDTRETDRSE